MVLFGKGIGQGFGPTLADKLDLERLPCVRKGLERGLGLTLVDRFGRQELYEKKGLARGLESTLVDEFDQHGLA